jgi:ribonuclease E
VLYAGEVNWDAAGLEGQPKRIELALKAGDEVMVQVTKDPIGQKGARLTSQVSLPGRFLVYVPQGGMTGISRKLPDRERGRLKRILKTIVPEDAGVIVRTAAEGASEEQLRQDVERLAAEWQAIESKAGSASAPTVLRSEPDLAIKVVRDIFNEDFGSLTISGNALFDEVSSYVSAVAPDLVERTRKWVENDDVFATRRIDEQLAKALDRKVWLPSGGSLVIDRTEAMTVIDVNTGKFVGKGGNLEETVTRNNLEAAEEIVRQLRLRDIGGIIVVDFIDMVLESNRELVLRRLVECLSRDRTKHQVAEVTSLGLVQMTRKRIGQGLLETFSTSCEACNGRGVKVQSEPLAVHSSSGATRVRRQRITGPIPGAPIATPAAGDAAETADASDATDVPEVTGASEPTADAVEVTGASEPTADAVEAARDEEVGADSDAAAESATEASDGAPAPPDVASHNEGEPEATEGAGEPDDASIPTQGETPDVVGGNPSATDSQTR